MSRYDTVKPRRPHMRTFRTFRDGDYLPEISTPAHHSVALGEGADARILQVTVSLIAQREGHSALGHVVGLYAKLELNTVDRDAPVTYFLSRLQGG